MWFNAIGSNFNVGHEPCLHDHVTGHVVCRRSFSLELVRERDSNNILLTCLSDGTPYSFSFTFTLLSTSPLLYYLSFLPCPILPSCLDGFNLISHSSLFGQKNSGLRKLYFSHLHSILLPLESKQCPLTLASVLVSAVSAEELRF